jgi:signal transduction histidine kinase
LATTGIPGFQRRLRGVVGEVLIPAKAFGDLSLEKRFLWEFRTSGFSAMILFGFVGAGMTAIMLVYELFAVQKLLGPTLGELANRTLVLLVLTGMALILLIKPEYAAERHRWLVVLPIAACLLAISGATIFSVDEQKLRSFRIVGSMILATIGAYACTRARPWEIAPWALLSGVLTTIGLTLAKEPAPYAVLVYLVVGNIVGWCLCVYMEHRERRLFIQAAHLEKLSKDFSAKVNEAERGGRERERLLRVVAHDLRQPVTSLQLQLLRLSTTTRLGEMENDPLPQALACVAMLQESVDRLLAPVDAKAQMPRLTLVDPARIVSRINSVYCSEGSDIEEHVYLMYFRDSLPTVLTHEESIWTVLNNLIENSMKFRALNASRRPKVLVAFTVLKEKIRIDILDNGCGIPREQIQLVFEPYWQASYGEISSTKSNRKPGVGLGLAIVQETIGQLGGHSISLESKLGVGTRVRVYLPRALSTKSRVSKNH